MHIEARGLGRRFGRKTALEDVSFECPAGEIVALIGNNGAGKTTLLQVIAGLLVPTSGAVFLDGDPVDRRSEARRRSMGVLPDFPAFFPSHTVLQHLAMVCRLHAVDDSDLETRAVALMEEIGLLELGGQRLLTLSRGQIYKTVFVSLLLARPRLWLLDEPMASGMDPQGLAFLRKHLRDQAESGATVLYSTQIADVAERFSDRVFVLDGGRLKIQESPQALLKRAGAPDLEQALQLLAASDERPPA